MTMMVSSMEAMQDNSPRSRPGLSRFSAYGVSCLPEYIIIAGCYDTFRRETDTKYALRYSVRLRNLLLVPIGAIIKLLFSNNYSKE
jgi:hypothetical protein